MAIEITVWNIVDGIYYDAELPGINRDRVVEIAILGGSVRKKLSGKIVGGICSQTQADVLLIREDPQSPCYIWTDDCDLGLSAQQALDFAGGQRTAAHYQTRLTHQVEGDRIIARGHDQWARGSGSGISFVTPSSCFCI
jgi:hypothetical protein